MRSAPALGVCSAEVGSQLHLVRKNLAKRPTSYQAAVWLMIILIVLLHCSLAVCTYNLFIYGTFNALV